MLLVVRLPPAAASAASVSSAAAAVSLTAAARIVDAAKNTCRWGEGGAQGQTANELLTRCGFDRVSKVNQSGCRPFRLYAVVHNTVAC